MERDTRFLLVAPDVPSAKAWCAERRIHSSQPIIITPRTKTDGPAYPPNGLDLVVIHRDVSGMTELLERVGVLVQAGVL